MPGGFATTATPTAVPGGQRARRADRDRPRRALGRQARARRRRGGDPRAVPRRRVPRGHGRRRSGRPTPSWAALRDRRRRRRRALQRHGRGPARRELRRPAGHLPQHHRGGRRCSRPAEDCYASLFTDRAHQLPRRAGVRPPRCGALDRRAEDGALRPGPRRASCSRSTPRPAFPTPSLINARLGPRRERSSAARSPRTSTPSSSPFLEQRGADADHRQQTSGRRSDKLVYADSSDEPTTNDRDRRRGAARASSSTTTRSSRWPAGRAHRGALRPADGHRVGQGRAHRRALHRPGSPRDRAVARRRRTLLDVYTLARDRRAARLTGLSDRPGDRRRASVQVIALGRRRRLASRTARSWSPR